MTDETIDITEKSPGIDQPRASISPTTPTVARSFMLTIAVSRGSSASSRVTTSRPASGLSAQGVDRPTRPRSRITASNALVTRMVGPYLVANSEDEWFTSAIVEWPSLTR